MEARRRCAPPTSCLFFGTFADLLWLSVLPPWTLRSQTSQIQTRTRTTLERSILRTTKLGDQGLRSFLLRLLVEQEAQEECLVAHLVDWLAAACSRSCSADKHLGSKRRDKDSSKARRPDSSSSSKEVSKEGKDQLSRCASSLHRVAASHSRRLSWAREQPAMAQEQLDNRLAKQLVQAQEERDQD